MEEKIRILIINGKMICGGVEAFIMNIYRHIDKNRIQFDFLVHYEDDCFYDEEIKQLGGKIFKLSFRNDNNYIKYKSDLKKFFTEHTEYRIIWGQMDGLASIYMKYAKKYGCRKTTIMHSHITNSEQSLKGIIKRILKTNICKYTDINWACSTEAGKYLYGDNQFYLCHNAIEVEKFKFDDEVRKRIRKSLNISNDTYVIGNIGRMVPQKNQLFLIDCFNEYCKNEKNEDSILLICGDGELRQELEIHIKELGIEDKVILTGNIPNANEIIQAMDIFVLPSLYEGLPVSGIEAQTSGLHCLLSNTITTETNICENGCTFIELNDINDWVKAFGAKYERKDSFINSVVDEGYSITDLVNRLETLFINIYFDNKWEGNLYYDM